MSNDEMYFNHSRSLVHSIFSLRRRLNLIQQKSVKFPTKNVTKSAGVTIAA